MLAVTMNGTAKLPVQSTSHVDKDPKKFTLRISSGGWNRCTRLSHGLNTPATINTDPTATRCRLKANTPRNH